MDTKIAPTRSNLIKLSEELQFAKMGHDLLDQKRSILVSELLSLIDQAAEHQDRMDAALAQANKDLQETIISMGRLRTANVSASVFIQSDFEITQRKVMSVNLPHVQTSFSENPPYFSPESTTVLLDKAVAGFRDALELMGSLAELKVSIMRLASEVKKTIRKVNSLEKITIPQTEQVMRQISERIEESERENYILLKAVKRNLEAKTEEEKNERSEPI